MQPPLASKATDSIRRRLVRWFLAVYWVLLVVGTHWPQDLLPGKGRLAPSDKSLHFFAYAILAGLLAIVLTERRDPPRIADQAIWPVWAWSLVALAIAVAFGLVDEVTQPWTGRDLNWSDWLADAAGATAGAAIVATLRTLWRARATAVPGVAR
jgi:VanZ family protein